MNSLILRWIVFIIVLPSLISCCLVSNQDQLSQFTVLKGRELVDLPDLGMKSLPARIDTGAKTSALHATQIEFFYKSNIPWVKFNTGSVWKEQPLLRSAKVKGTCGESNTRPVIRTTVKIGSYIRQIDLTLVDRSRMKHPFLLGREAMQTDVLVNPEMTFDEDD